MTNVTITNGTVSFGQTIKTGDFENKKGEVSLSFTIAEDSDPDMAILIVSSKAQAHLEKMLTGKNKVLEVSAPEEKPKKTATKIPAAPTPAKASPDACEVVDEPEKNPPYIAKQVAAANAKAAEEVDDNDLGDLMGGTSPKVITDKELNDATQKCQDAHRNGPGIRKLLASLGIKPPARIIDLPQDKRQEYLDGLLEIKPLA